MILGKNELVTSTSEFAAGTNRYVMNSALGIDTPSPMLGATVHVNDVAEIHVKALDSTVHGNKNFIASAESVKWENLSGVLKQEFPSAFEKGFLKLGGKMVTKDVSFDTTDTEKVFGIQWKGFDEQLRSVVEHYLEIKTQETK